MFRILGIQLISLSLSVIDFVFNDNVFRAGAWPHDITDPFHDQCYRTICKCSFGTGKAGDSFGLNKTLNFYGS